MSDAVKSTAAFPKGESSIDSGSAPPKFDPPRDSGTGARTKFDPREKFPVADLVGFRVAEIGTGRAVTTMQTGPQHANPMGTLHGGILCDLADAAMGIAFASTLQPEQSFTTVEMRINFFRPVWSSVLTAEAIVAQRGKTMGYVECSVKDENGKLVAKSTSTCMALSGDRAAGR